MLRITTQENPTAITFVLEGKCRGPWVDELEQCWRKAAAGAMAKKLRVDLAQVGFVDDRGKELLAKMCAAGVELSAAGLMISSLIQEIAASCSQAQSKELSDVGVSDLQA